MKSINLEVDCFNIHYLQQVPAGDDGKGTIIFLHGRALSVDLWEHQFADPILAGYDLVAFDLPGHGSSGRSSDFETRYSLSGASALLIQFVSLLNIKEFVLVGHSFGGHIALQSFRDLPLCKGLLLITLPITKPLQALSMYLNIDLLSKVFSETVSARDLEEYASKILHPNAEDVPSFIVKSYRESDKKIHPAILQGLISEEYLDEVELIQKSTVPIAIVAGQGEQIHNLSYIDGLRLPLWRSGIQLVACAGHLLPWENSSAFNSLLCEFCYDVFDREY